MNIQEAKYILLLYRPGMADGQDPELEKALELARQDPELGRWFEQHQALQNSLRSNFRQISVPADLAATLKARLSAALPSPQSAESARPQRKPARVRETPVPIWLRPLAWWQSPAWLALATGVVLLVGLASFWLRPPRPDRFANYEAMMVSKALGGYNMECETNDMQQLRQYLATKGAPADYALVPGLQKLQLLGGTPLTWRSHPVSMVCFDRPDGQKVWLFVMASSALKNPPPKVPTQNKISSLMTASWTAGDKIYVLAGPPENGFKERYL